jgi:hypothetical protein
MKIHVEFGSGPRLLSALVMLLLVAACGNATPLQDFRDSNAAFYAFLTGTGSRPPSSPSQAEGEEVLVCPEVETHQDAAYYDVYDPKAPHEDKNVRYQAVINKFARQCDFQPDYFAIKLGFAGRVLVGPAGGPGQVTLPVRAELAGKGDKVVWTKTYKVPVTIPPNLGSQFFAQVTDDLVYQPRFGDKMEDFRLYIGFAKEDETSNPRAATR